MNLLECARSFVTVSELGSFARAADRLDLSAAAVSRHIQYLEESLGERLLQRTTRRVHLTETGRLCLERYQRVFDELDELTQMVQGRRAEPQGLLRVASTTLFWMKQVAPVLPDFLKRYPKMSIQVNLTEDVVDLIGNGYDLSLHFQRPTGQTLVARSLRVLRRVLYASPDYLRDHGTPRSLNDLADHNCLVYAHSGEQVEWQFWDKDGSDLRVPVKGSLRSNDASTLRLAALAGLGIGWGPRFILTEDLDEGRLVELLPQYRCDARDLWMVYPSRRQLAPKVRFFIDFLEERCQD
ncbi:LysR family transcriptional regulator [Hydrogenophaga sp. BPS33]|uniref:LysR family transcriptional regulator n=1 Tax=Hydrogenophaga sp. BPS33 TaxID=2651974 RepID=UPI00131F81EC|nr:LysR family transcriptional regulator [Hydrogenophaga sp. BPS33]QHE87482.1 LysR family transcriptional regulator [Hydrogenophaga sp. BPS33]